MDIFRRNNFWTCIFVMDIAQKLHFRERDRKRESSMQVEKITKPNFTSALNSIKNHCNSRIRESIEVASERECTCTFWPNEKWRWKYFCLKYSKYRSYISGIVSFEHCNTTNTEHVPTEHAIYSILTVYTSMSLLFALICRLHYHFPYRTN